MGESMMFKLKRERLFYCTAEQIGVVFPIWPNNLWFMYPWRQMQQKVIDKLAARLNEGEHNSHLLTITTLCILVQKGLDTAVAREGLGWMSVFYQKQRLHSVFNHNQFISVSLLDFTNKMTQNKYFRVRKRGKCELSNYNEELRVGRSLIEAYVLQCTPAK